MSGVSIINYMLSNDYQLASVVAPENIISGTIPLNTEYPAISIRQVSGLEYKTIRRTGDQLVTERVQVAAYASTYSQQKEIIELIRNALLTTRSNVSAFAVDSITQDIDGPDLYSENPVTFEQSIDYMVRFNR